MVGGLQDLGGRLFPERQILLRSAEHVRAVLLPSWLQAMIIFACVATIGGMSYLAVGYFAMHRELDRAGMSSRAARITARQDANAEASAVATLNQQLAGVNDQYAALKQRYDAMVANQSANTVATDQAQEDLQQKLKQAEQQLSTNNGDVAQLKKSIDELRASLKRSEQARSAESTHARELEAEMHTLTARANLLKAIVNSKDEQLARLRALVANPNEQVGQVPPSAPPAATPGTTNPQKQSALKSEPLADNSDATVPSTQLGSANGTHHQTTKLEQILASTGVDITKMIRRISPQSEPDVGGPFIALDSMRSNAIEHRRIAALLKIAKLLPLRSPLAIHYRIDSPFGPRRDPFNHRAAFHPGIDLGAPYRTPVYSTAPGVIIFTGWQEGYGRTVEIDHGHGIVTLYAHLHRILVARGQHVAAHVEIAQLGSTGRSTGPHLHYEIRLDGRPVNPEKFLEAGKHVVQASAH